MRAKFVNEEDHYKTHSRVKKEKAPPLSDYEKERLAYQKEQDEINKEKERSQSYISSNVKETKGRIGDSNYNANLYEEVVIRHPFVKKILEGIFHTNPHYALHQIQEAEDGVSCWFYQSMGAWFHKPEDMQLLLKHKVSFQVNYDYEAREKFMISINY